MATWDIRSKNDRLPDHSFFSLGCAGYVADLFEKMLISRIQ